MVKIQRSIYVAFYISSVLLLHSCGGSIPYKTTQKYAGYQDTGKASYYAMKYQLRKTASGERFNQLALTAAHKKLPFGTKVLVTNVKNGKNVEVKINDRGPFVKGRIIDLTRKAFSKIASLDSGVIDVKIKDIK